MTRVYIGIGSNIAPETHMRQALHRLRKVARIVSVSTIYRTPAEGCPEQPPFYNGVVAIETDLPPRELKLMLREIEDALGRRRSADRYAARTIDLDILLYDTLVVTANGLVIPDPEIVQRAFLAVPLAELAPDLVLPGDGRPLREIAQMAESAALEPLNDYTRQMRKEIDDEPTAR